MTILVTPCEVSACVRSEQRLRLFLGSFGSQLPQSPSIRGTPPEDPQPKIVNLSFM